MVHGKVRNFPYHRIAAVLMAAWLEEMSSITAKGQTTLPKSVRHALGIDRGGKIAFRVDNQRVSVIRAEVEREDPTVDAFLEFLAIDMGRRPQALFSF
jgi:antitoxin PrlF